MAYVTCGVAATWYLTNLRLHRVLHRAWRILGRYPKRGMSEYELNTLVRSFGYTLWWPEEDPHSRLFGKPVSSPEVRSFLRGCGPVILIVSMRNCKHDHALYIVPGGRFYKDNRHSTSTPLHTAKHYFYIDAIAPCKSV